MLTSSLGCSNGSIPTPILKALASAWPACGASFSGMADALGPKALWTAAPHSIYRCQKIRRWTMERSRQILVVDDDPRNVELIVSALTEQIGRASCRER